MSRLAAIGVCADSPRAYEVQAAIGLKKNIFKAIFSFELLRIIYYLTVT